MKSALIALSPVARAADFTVESGFVSLFNGKDLTGWGYSVKDTFEGKTTSSDGRFSVADGILKVNAREPRSIKNLWTISMFPRDFVLRLEFRAGVDADSGIFLRGLQLQCRDYLVAGPYKQLKKYRPQDWNEIEIVVIDGTARCTCNGELLTDALDIPPNGMMGLEADRGQMEYRRIRIKEVSR